MAQASTAGRRPPCLVSRPAAGAKREPLSWAVMPPVFTGVPEDVRRRLAYLGPHGQARADLAGVAAIVALLAQLLFAQLTLLVTGCLLVTDRAARWRPAWLAVPAACGLAWALSVGTRHAVTGYLSGGNQVIGALAGPGPALARLSRLPAVLRGWQHWLPGQVPVAVIAASAQAACLIGVRGRPRRRRHRRGLIAVARAAYAAAAIRHGEVATADGGCFGVQPATGRPVGVSWAEASSGVLCTGRDGAGVRNAGYRLAAAAIQRRKTVIIVDLAGAVDDSQVAADLRVAVPRECALAGAPVRMFGHDAGYQPLPAADPDRGTDLVLAMTDWRGTTRAQQQFSAAYVNAALAVIAAAARHGRQEPAVLDELADLLRPGKLDARLRRLACERGPAGGAGPVPARAVELAGQLGREPELVRPVAAQLGIVRSSAIGEWLRPSAGAAPLTPARAAGDCARTWPGYLSAWPDRRARPGRDTGPADRSGSAGPSRCGSAGTAISLSRAVADREVVLFSLDRRLHGRSAAAVARLAVADLTALLAGQAAQRATADCLVWITGCELLDPRRLGALVAAAAGSGTAVLLDTAAEPAAIRLASDVNVVVTSGPVPPSLAAMLGAPAARASADVCGPGPAAAAMAGRRHAGAADEALLAQRPGELSVLIRGPRPRVMLRCRAVPASNRDPGRPVRRWLA